jgi:hypothetical protein
MRRGAAYRKPNMVIHDKSLSYANRQAIVTSNRFKMHDIKIEFSTLEQAREVAEKVGITKSGWKRLSPYKCGYGDHYHLTSKHRKKIAHPKP